jgi:hypothetical protein
VQVETILVDLGTGMREWIEVRQGHQVEYCTDRTELLQLLCRRGLRYEDLVAVDTIDDGCE